MDRLVKFTKKTIGRIVEKKTGARTEVRAPVCGVYTSRVVPVLTHGGVISAHVGSDPFLSIL